jgi:Ca2+-binding EF-hand superfamily protein
MDQKRKSIVGKRWSQAAVGGMGLKTQNAFDSKGGSAPKYVELLEKAFDAYGENGKLLKDDVPKVLAASLGRYLERELEDMVEEHEDGAELQFHDIKQMISNTAPFITENWQPVMASRAGKPSGYKLDHTDIFQQLYESQRMLVDSGSGSDGGIEIHAVEYILSSCGEELSHEDFDELLDKIKHPRKGNFEMQKLIMYLAGLLEEVGLEGSEAQAKAMVKQCEALSDRANPPAPKPARKATVVSIESKSSAPTEEKPAKAEKDEKPAAPEAPAPAAESPAPKEEPKEEAKDEGKAQEAEDADPN